VLNCFSIKRLFYNSSDKAFYNKIKNITKLSIRNLTLYKLVFQHKCNNAEHFSNERLEFLGDAALSLIIGDFLFRKYPARDEGFLTDIRSRIVNRESLGIVANKMGIHLLLHYDSSHGKSRHIYGNTLEALVGAVYLDRGYDNCYKFVLHQLPHKHIDLDYLIANDTNFKSALLEWASKNQKQISFEVIDKVETDTNIFNFQVQISLDGLPVCLGEARSKKQADQNAARKALEVFGVKPSSG